MNVNIMMYIFMGLTYMLLFFIIFMRKEISDGVKLRMMANKGYVNILFLDKDKRLKHFVLKGNDLGGFNIAGGFYAIVKEKLFQYNRSPTYFYVEGNYKPIDLNDVKTSGEVDAVLVDKIIIRAKSIGALADFIKQIRLIVIILFIVALLSIVNAYFGFKLYKFFQNVINTTFEKAITYLINPQASTVLTG